MEQQLWHEIETIEESKKMRYVTSVEKIGIAKGRQQGWQEGLEQGLLQGESKLLRKLLEHRFGVLPSWATDKLKCATEQDLEGWGEAVLTAPNLGAVFDNGVTH
jgi:flagellar biosynthesis/type III secretory pathway protein FliH